MYYYVYTWHRDWVKTKLAVPEDSKSIKKNLNRKNADELAKKKQRKGP